MKKTTVLISLLVLTLGINAKSKQPVPEIIMIGIGERNPTFNESLYPDITFYYTPDLVSQAQAGEAVKAAVALSGAARESFSGEPEFIANVNDEHDLKKAFFVFDKNGVCYSHGYDIGRRGDLIKTVGIDGNSLGDTFKDVLTKEKEAKKSKKEMKIKKDDFMLGHQMPDFNIVSPDGASVSIKSITESGKPVMIIFFQLSKDLDIQAAKESGKGKSGKSFGKAMLSGAAGVTLTNLCNSIESEFFQYDVEE